MTKEERTMIRDFVGRPGIQWHKYKGGPSPTKMKLVDFKPAARAWGEWVLRNMVPVSTRFMKSFNSRITMVIIKMSRWITYSGGMTSCRYNTNIRNRFSRSR
jgi:hypothetical protein